MLSNPIKTHYNFVEWQLDGKKVTEIASGSYGDKTIVAVWTPTVYTITYKLAGGTTTNVTEYTIESEAITLSNPAKLGYTFTGWSGTGINGIIKTVVVPTGSVGDREYTANWQIITYTITYELNGGLGDVSNYVKTYTVETDDIALPTPTKEEYAFAGWYANAIFRNKISVITKGTTGNKTLYAKWVKPFTYTSSGYITGLSQEASLSDIVIPAEIDGVKIIGIEIGAFKDNQRIKTVKLPGTITYIGRVAFAGCANLTEISGTDGITFIGQWAFYGCQSLNEFVLGKGVTLQDGAFIDCNFTLYTSESSEPSTWEKTWDDGFSGTTVWGYSCIKIDGIMYGIKDGYATVVCQSQNIAGDITIASAVDYHEKKYVVTSIATSAFEGCTSLKIITIPDSVISLGNLVFQGCTSLEKVIIGNNVNSIGAMIFYGCNNLKSVSFSDGSNWYRINYESSNAYTNWQNKTGGVNIDLSNSSNNVSLFKANSGYYYWYKK